MSPGARTARPGASLNGHGTLRAVSDAEAIEARFEAEASARLKGVALNRVDAWRVEMEDLGEERGIPRGRVHQILTRVEDDPAELRTTRRAVVSVVSNVTAERVSWLWHARVPRGKLVDLAGDPGVGKSTLLLDLGARITRGSPLPDGQRPKGAADVLILSAEDGVADTIQPRLAAAGADLSRAHVLTAVEGDDGLPRPWALPEDLDLLEVEIRRVSAALVIIDPVSAFLSAAIDAHKDHSVRRALHPLAQVADRTGAAVVMVRHLTKSEGGKAIYRAGGSIAFTAAARVGLLVAKDPGNEDVRVVAISKSNLEAEAPALSYRLVGDEERGCATVAWEGATTHTADQLLAVPADEEERNALTEATGWIRDFLEAGPRQVTEVRKKARDYGVAPRTLQRAAKQAGVISWRKGFGPGSTYWWRLETELPLETDGEHGEHGPKPV
jgi:hypothetical protein